MVCKGILWCENLASQTHTLKSYIWVRLTECVKSYETHRAERTEEKRLEKNLKNTGSTIEWGWKGGWGGPDPKLDFPTSFISIEPKLSKFVFRIVSG